MLSSHRTPKLHSLIKVLGLKINLNLNLLLFIVYGELSINVLDETNAMPLTCSLILNGK